MIRQSDSATITSWAVSFHTDPSNGLSVDSMFSDHPRFGSVTSVTTNKTMGVPSGSFTIQFKKPPKFASASPQRQIWRDVEDVWVKLYCLIDGEPHRVMTGLVDSMRGSNSRGTDGAAVESYTLNGRDFGKVFEQSSLFSDFLHPALNSLPSVTAISAAAQGRQIGTPAHFIKTVIELWFGNGGDTSETQWMLPPGLGGGSFFSLLSGAGIQNMSSARNGIAVAPVLFAQHQDTVLWETLSDWANGDFNELFVDEAVPFEASGYGDTPNSRNSEQRPTIFLRERPFPVYTNGEVDTASWDRLKRHTLLPADVNSLDLAKGGAAVRFNYWSLQALGLSADQFDLAALSQQYENGGRYAGWPGKAPIWSSDSIARHGLRRKVISTKYLGAHLIGNDPEAEKDYMKLGLEWLKRYHDWFVVAPFELSGSIKCSRCFPEIRIGQRVRYAGPEGQITFYVEGVQHSQTAPLAGSTTLTVTRGTFEHDEPLDYVYNLYANPRAATQADDCMRLGGADFDREAIADAGLLDDQCRFIAIDPSPRANVHSSSLGANQGNVDDSSHFSVERTNGAVLEVERDGTIPMSIDGAMTFELEPLPPTTPAATASPAASPLPVEALEAGTPIATEENPTPSDSLDVDVDRISDDPIGGLEDLL